MITGIKVIVFDADGMVIKGERPSLRLARDFNVPMEELNQFFDNEFKGCVLGRRDLKEVVTPYLPKWGWTDSVEEFLHFWFAESYHSDQEILALVRDLRKSGIICILSTNQEKYRADFMRKEMGLEKVFDHILASSDIGYKKPQRQYLEALMKFIPGISPHEVLFFDDRKENVETARDFGFRGELYTGISSFREIIESKRKDANVSVAS